MGQAWPDRAEMQASAGAAPVEARPTLATKEPRPCAGCAARDQVIERQRTEIEALRQTVTQCNALQSSVTPESVTRNVTQRNTVTRSNADRQRDYRARQRAAKT